MSDPSLRIYDRCVRNPVHMLSGSISHIDIAGQHPLLVSQIIKVFARANHKPRRRRVYTIPSFYDIK